GTLGLKFNRYVPMEIIVFDGVAKIGDKIDCRAGFYWNAGQRGGLFGMLDGPLGGDSTGSQDAASNAVALVAGMTEHTGDADYTRSGRDPAANDAMCR